MKYLVIINKTSTMSRRFKAMFLERKEENYQIFDLLEQKANDLPTLTNDNIDVFQASKLNADNIEDIEPLMRAIGFRKCDLCGAWITPQDIRYGHSEYDGDKRYCPVCTAKKNGKRLPKHGYHSTSHLVRVINADGENFDLSNVFGIGFEAEYYNPNSSDGYIKCTDTFYEMACDDSPNRMFRLENDGSCSGEIISNVFTKKALYAFNFEVITDVLKLNGNVDGNRYAGLHVHLSKLWLGANNDPKTQCLNYLKLQYFMKSYEDDFFKLSGRKDRSVMGYCQFFSYREIEEMKNDIQHNDNPWDYMPCDHGGGSGCALNSSGKTIEFRIGANTNDPERLRHYILFILGITEGIKNVPFEKCYCLGKVTKMVPADTMAYWRRHGCFLNTNAIDTRGVTL